MNDNIKKGDNEDDQQKLKALEEEVQSLANLQKSLKNKKEEQEKRKKELEDKLSEKYKYSKELEQENVFLDGIKESLEDGTKRLEESSHKLEEKLSEETHKSLESEQEKFILQEISKSETAKKRSVQRKYFISLTLAAILIAAIFGTFYYYESIKNAERERILSSPVKGKFLIKNLKGETVSSWAAWNIVKGETLIVSITNPKNYPKDKIGAIKDAILSEETVEVDSSLVHKDLAGATAVYYKGWKGALEKAGQTQTERYIPTKIEVLEESKEANINIELLDDLDADGNSGYTNSIVDQNQMLLATIKIYLVKDLTDDRLATIVRHEFGHALGLTHSTDPEDLMAPVTATKHPYISQCDIDAVKSLYDGNKKSEVICEK